MMLGRKQIQSPKCNAIKHLYAYMLHVSVVILSLARGERSMMASAVKTDFLEGTQEFAITPYVTGHVLIVLKNCVSI